MPKDLNSRTKIVHYVCAALLLVLLVMQFTPFWHIPESGEAVSIGGYIWFPTEHTDLTSYLQETISEDFLVNNVLIPCILMLVLSAFGIVLCVIKAGDLLPSLFPAACGLSGIIGFLAKPALRLGSGWVWMLLISIVLLAGGVYAIWLQWKATQAA